MKPIYVLIGAIVFIFLLVFLILGLRNPSSTNQTINTKNVILADYSDQDTTVTYTRNGVINGEEDHRAIRITVSKNSRMLEVIQGYQGTVINSQSFVNNTQAYRAFLASLQTSGYLQERRSTIQDPEGQCPLGNQFLFTTSNVKDAPKQLWSTSCSTIRGTFGGNLGTVQNLFQRQIPNYSQLIKGVNLN